jgi:ferritin-like metal-binding protein YciE
VYFEKDRTKYSTSENNQSEGHTEGHTENHGNLTEKQVKRLFAIANSKGYNAESVKKAAMKKYNVTEIAQLTKAQYDEMCNGYEGLPDKQ